MFRTERNDGNPYKSSNLVIGYVYFLIETVVEVEGFIPEMIKIIIIEQDQWGHDGCIYQKSPKLTLACSSSTYFSEINQINKCAFDWNDFRKDGKNARENFSYLVGEKNEKNK